MNAAQPRHSRCRGDAGVTLIEILVSIVILGLCVVSILVGTSTLPVAAGAHRQDTQIDIALKQWAEAIKAKGFISGNLCVSSSNNPYSVNQLTSANPKVLPVGFPNIGAAGLTADLPVVTTSIGGSSPVFSGCNANTAVLVRVQLTVHSTSTVPRTNGQTLQVVVAAVSP
jgi:prepilin-type N-terminal cleavage/methylation domain-containing protein